MASETWGPILDDNDFDWPYRAMTTVRPQLPTGGSTPTVASCELRSVRTTSTSIPQICGPDDHGRYR